MMSFKADLSLTSPSPVIFTKKTVTQQPPPVEVSTAWAELGHGLHP